MTTLTRYTRQFVRYLRNNKAVSALEYAILVGVVAVAAVALLATFNDTLKTAVDQIGTNISGTTSGTGTAPSPAPTN